MQRKKYVAESYRASTRAALLKLPPVLGVGRDVILKLVIRWVTEQS